MSCGVVYFGFVLLKQTQLQLTPKAPLTIEKRTAARLVGSRYLTELEQLRAFQKSNFYRTIIDNNLFRPLGWTPPWPREPYRLLGTLIPINGNTPSQAILQTTTTRTTHIVSIGDRLDLETTVTDIQPKKVLLEKAGQKPRILALNPTPWIK